MKKKIELPDFLQGGFLSFRLREPEELIVGAEAYSYWTEYECDIVIRYYEDGKDDLVVGNFSVSHFRAFIAASDGRNDYDAFDTYGSCNYDQYADIIWDREKRELSEAFVKVSGWDCLPGDLFLLMSINIFPEYRGYELGNAVTWLFYRNFCRSSDFLLLLAFPLQYSCNDEERNKCEPDEFSGSEQECTRRMSNYYKKLGFKRIGRTNFYFFSCEFPMNRPEILDYIR